MMRGLKMVRGVVLASSAMALAAPSAAAPGDVVHYGTWGVDLNSRDLKVRPGDDFERYASGHWMDVTDISADKTSNSVGSDLNDRIQEQLRDIITSAPASSKLGALYRSFTDEGVIETVGSRPLLRDLARVDSIRTKAELAWFMADTTGKFGSTLFSVFVLPDPNHPTMNLAGVATSGKGLPDRDYYLVDKYKPQRDAYRAYVERALRMAGTPGAAAKADAILAFETEIAKLNWPRAEMRDMSKLNNQMSVAQLQGYAPGIGWKSYLERTGAVSPKILVADNSAVKALAALYAKTPLATLKAWERFHVIDQAAPYLSKQFVDSQFAFAKTLSGAQELRPRWRRGIALVDGTLGELLGKTYVERYFPPSSKAKMEALVANLKLAAAERIKSNGWMEPATKEAALTKLGRMAVMVGYPEKLRDYDGLELKPDDLYGNMQRAAAFDWAYQLSDLNKPVDRKKWGMSPATVNAYNGGLENKIVFPAGILSPPFFDPTADDAVNYGAIGAVIGHEIMHGFDDQGRKIDENGALRDWWTPGDAERFTKLTAALGKQYSSYEAAPGAFINGNLTMGENIGDMSGLEVAYAAYHKALGGKEAPVIDGLTGDQRFFLAFAQAWRGEQREDSIKTQIATDPHSPRRYRVIGPLRNLDAWYKAFNVTPDSKFYIPPEQRVRIW